MAIALDGSPEREGLYLRPAVCVLQTTRLWKIACPGGIRALSICITSRLVIFAVTETYKLDRGSRGRRAWGGPWYFPPDGEDVIMTFYAVNAEDGRVISRWQR